MTVHPFPVARRQTTSSTARLSKPPADPSVVANLVTLAPLSAVSLVALHVQVNQAARELTRAAQVKTVAIRVPLANRPDIVIRNGRRPSDPARKPVLLPELITRHLQPVLSSVWRLAEVTFTYNGYHLVYQASWQPSGLTVLPGALCN